jgi:antitoxin component of MazEF toxin-antitoxin module
MHSLSADQIVKIYTQPELAKQLDISQWMLLVLVLRNQQLLACYSARFKQADMFEQIPSKPQRHFKNADVLADNHKQQVLFEAKELKSMLGNGYEYLLFLKGAGYTLSKDKVGETRVYNDIDVLADKSSIENIERRLCMLGWMSEELTDHDEKYYRKWAHEIPPLRHGKRGEPDFQLLMLGCGN